MAHMLRPENLAGTLILLLGPIWPDTHVMKLIAIYGGTHRTYTQPALSRAQRVNLSSHKTTARSGLALFAWTFERELLGYEKRVAPKNLDALRVSLCRIKLRLQKNDSIIHVF